MTELEKGRRRAVRKARREACNRVVAYRAWLKQDVVYTQRVRAAEAGIGRHPGKRPPMPVPPSDNDYKIAREEGIPR